MSLLKKEYFHVSSFWNRIVLIFQSRPESFWGWRELVSCRKCACRIHLEAEWLNQHICSRCWTCAYTGAKHNTGGKHKRPYRWNEKKSNYNNCTLSVSVFVSSVHYFLCLYGFYMTAFSSLFIPLCLSGWRLCNWQLYKAHSHRRARHHLLYPAAPEREGGGNPTGAIAGDGQSS